MPRTIAPSVWRVRIDGLTWYDAGSDVNWPDHGGAYVRPADPEDLDGLWIGIRYDGGWEGDPYYNRDGYPPNATVYEIFTDDLPAVLFDECGLDPATATPYERAAVAMTTGYGLQAVNSVTGPHPFRVRAIAARLALGSFIDPDPKYTIR